MHRVCLFALVLLALNASAKQFSFREDGSFTILQMTDLHLYLNSSVDNVTVQAERTLIETTKPDLVIVTGDIASNGHKEVFDGFFEQAWKEFSQVFIDTQTYYAITLGNHDTEMDLNSRQIMELDMTNPYSVSQMGDFKNPATYTIPVYSRLDPGNVTANLWVFDTGDYGCNGHSSGYGCIENDQIDWYNQESAAFKAKYGAGAHHLAFLHIPIPEYIQAFGRSIVYGEKGEMTTCPYYNTGFFFEVKKNADISGMFCGHDHDNNFGGWVDGVELVYGRKTGKGYYGPMPDAKIGGRVIKLYETKNPDGSITVSREHYIINFDGTIETHYKYYLRVGQAQTQCYGPTGKTMGVDNILYDYWQEIVMAAGILFTLIFVVCTLNKLRKKQDHLIKFVDEPETTNSVRA